MSSPSVIMGVSWGMGTDGALPFLRSIRMSGYDGRVILIVAKTDPNDIAILRDYAEVIQVDDAYPTVSPRWALSLLHWCKTTRGLRKHYPRVFVEVARVLRAKPGSPRARDLEFQLHGLQSHRYSHYSEALLSIAPEAECVMITDVRDVVVQRPPFENLKRVEFFLETGHDTFLGHGFNARWIRDLYGDDILATLANHSVSCSGVTIGPREAMLDYLSAMTQEVKRHTYPLGPHDQAIHNYLIAIGTFPEALLVVNGAGRVRTVAFEEAIPVSPNGEVLDDAGDVVPVVHQFDRHADLRALIEGKYGRESAGGAISEKR